MTDLVPLFSFIIPTFNRAHLLPRCIASVQQQPLAEWELIVADDGSTDETEQLVAGIARADRRVSYQRQENQGAGIARNLGASVARGQYLVFLDSDDELLPQWGGSFQEAAVAGDAAIVCCDIHFANANGEVTNTSMPVPVDDGNLSRGGLFRSGTFAIRSEVFNAVGGYALGLRANQHSEFAYRLLPMRHRFGWKLQNMDHVLVVAHDHDGAKVRKDTRAIFESGEYILTRHRELLKGNRLGYSHWAAAVGGCAAKMQRYRDARHWFTQAIAARPWVPKNYGRWLLTLSPGLRALVWRPEATPEK